MKTKYNGIDISKDVAILLKRVIVDDNAMIFLPVEVLIGYYNDEYDYFETASGEVYHSVSDTIIGIGTDEFCFMDPLTDIELMEMYADKENFSYANAIKKYSSEYDEKIYIALLGEYINTQDKDYLFCGFDIKELVSNSLADPQDLGVQYHINALQKYIDKLKDLEASDGEEKILKTIEPYTSALVELWNAIVPTEQQYVMKSSNPIKVSEQEVEAIKENLAEKINAKEICSRIKETVIGQDEHIDRLVYEILRLERVKAKCPDKNAGVLLTGRTGVGKTKIVSMLGEYLDRPVFTIDSTQLSIPGYVGMSIEDFLQQLYDSEKGNLERIERSIIIFDEIDKKGSDRNQDVSGKGVLNTLLKFLDGTTYTIRKGKTIKTNNMIVIFSGAFSNVYQYSDSKSGIGFINEQVNKTVINTEEFMRKAQFPDESMGRFPIFIRLNDLTKEALINILKSSKESDIEIQKAIIEEYGFTLEVEDDYYEAVAEVAIKEGTGARSLQKIVYETTSEIFKWIIDHTSDDECEYDKIVINKETVQNPKKFKLKQTHNNKKMKILN